MNIIFVCFCIILDINECMDDVYNCYLDGFCININGLFYCICYVGYIGDGVNCIGKSWKIKFNVYCIG